MKALFQSLLALSLCLPISVTAQDATSQPQNAPTAMQGSTQNTTQDATPLTTQDQKNDADQVQPMDQTPTFRVNVIGRTTKAVNYHFRSGSTKVDLTGTDLMPSVHGSAKV
jgi:hypothetical protein